MSLGHSPSWVLLCKNCLLRHPTPKDSPPGSSHCPSSGAGHPRPLSLQALLPGPSGSTGHLDRPCLGLVSLTQDKPLPSVGHRQAFPTNFFHPEVLVCVLGFPCPLPSLGPSDISVATSESIMVSISPTRGCLSLSPSHNLTLQVSEVRYYLYFRFVNEKWVGGVETVPRAH